MKLKLSGHFNAIYYCLANFPKRIELSVTAEFFQCRNINIGNNCHIGKQSILRGGDAAPHTLYIGNRVVIRENVYLSARKGIINIGDDCYLANRAWLGGRGRINIGANVVIGPNTVIVSSNRDYRNLIAPYHKMPEISGVINIGEFTWIGGNSTILPNVSIGSGCVIGAGSVVTKDVPDNTVCYGAPAEPIKVIERC